MANDTFGRYVWLIDLLKEKQEMTFNDISKAWEMNKSLNPYGTELPPRTFYNHINAIKDIFDIEIYSKGWLWQINPQSWIDMSLSKRSLLAKLSLNNAELDYDPLKDRILYEEDAVPDNEFLRLIAQAMNKEMRVILTYQEYGSVQETLHIAPYCLKMFNHRWYLLGEEKITKELRVFAMDDRMINVEMPKRPEFFYIPKSFNAKKYFESSVGVIVNDGEAEAVRIKAFGVQADCLRSAPLHISQKEVETAPEYAVFEFQLNPDSIELEQLFFSRIDQIEVLSPASLRKKMKDNINKMKKIYS
ncbi:MAG: WYL domain-containing protein [Bacteroidales bacterium]|nr:WYL domain-containing protein [Bacteroidales bacterium]